MNIKKLFNTKKEKLIDLFMLVILASAVFLLFFLI